MNNKSIFVGLTLAAVAAMSSSTNAYAQLGFQSGIPGLDELSRANDNAIRSMDPASQSARDQTYSPPSNIDELYQICAKQAQQAGFVVDTYCETISSQWGGCGVIGLTIEECYIVNFVGQNVPVPVALINSAQEKMQAYSGKLAASSNQFFGGPEIGVGPPIPPDSAVGGPFDYDDDWGESFCAPYCD